MACRSIGPARIGHRRIATIILGAPAQVGRPADVLPLRIGQEKTCCTRSCRKERTMSRSSILLHVLMAGTLLCAATPGPARGDQGDDLRLARKVVTAASKSFEYDDAMARYGTMAEIAQRMLQNREQRADLMVGIRNANAEIAVYPQNRRQWIPDQWAVYEQKLAWERNVTLLDREHEELNFRQQRIYEQELARAKESKRSIRPIRREAILEELNRLDRECDKALTELKEGIDESAREGHTDRRQVWERIQGTLASLDPPRDLPADSLRDFLKRFGRDRWLDGAANPVQAKPKAAPRPSTGKAKKKSSPATTKARAGALSS
jgi:hypothetical protein